MKKSIELSSEQIEALLNTLRERFEQNTARHSTLAWADVEAKLRAQPPKLWTLNEMERTGGEPDVIDYDRSRAEFIFYDCAPESPKERRSLCYDPQALVSRKDNKPKDSATGMAAAMDVTLLSEAQYRQLQQLGEFDLKTSSWVLTPPEIRDLGGALFCDRRYDTVFVYHNGAESYYGSRGFRSVLRV